MTDSRITAANNGQSVTYLAGMTESTITMDQIAAVTRELGPEAGLQALLLAVGAEARHRHGRHELGSPVASRVAAW